MAARVVKFFYLAFGREDFFNLRVVEFYIGKTAVGLLVVHADEHFVIGVLRQINFARVVFFGLHRINRVMNLGRGAAVGRAHGVFKNFRLKFFQELAEAANLQIVFDVFVHFLVGIVIGRQDVVQIFGVGRSRVRELFQKKRAMHLRNFFPNVLHKPITSCN